ncbi:uncharacterized protein Tco025E_04511 [Trypanosoma conorhini]|uniref:Uncharacterized protein n=1 Tax=Trypanosoma conorhini TaxID=83891 RepID=A0A422PL10_9TRYP|nr:uncharacterized protein Tco025E_04511 [Trypanosoma conorhini]RNF18394.1 hypothetical protein Tco025E_04511 [Trypanosoma conorhini]
MLDDLMELSVSSDCPSNNTAGDVRGASVTHRIFDPLRWDGASAAAHVARVNLPDAFARRRQRAVGVALVCPCCRALWLSREGWLTAASALRPYCFTGHTSPMRKTCGGAKWRYCCSWKPQRRRRCSRRASASSCGRSCGS